MSNWVNRTLLQAVLRRVEVQSANGPQPLGDAELLHRFAESRDEAAFSVLVSRHGPLVWAVCRNLLANESDAEDAFQATFLALLESAGRIRTRAIGAWLHGVAVRVAKMAKRSAGRRRQREQKAAVSEVNSPIANATWSQLQAAVHEEVGNLAEPLRVAFVLCNLQGKSQREVAAELGWKIGTLSGRLSLARRELLERLSKRGVAAGSVVTAAVAGGAEASAGAPPVLVTKVAALARGGIDLGSVVSPTLLELARAATEVTMLRTKLFGLAVALTGILVMGLTVLPLGSAQERKAPPIIPGAPGGVGGDASPQQGQPGMGMPGMPGMPGMGGGGSGRRPTPAWEYKYVVRRSSRLDDFQKVLSTNAADGWEYVGTESLQIGDANKKSDVEAPILVFKRPAATSRRGASGTSAGQPGVMGGQLGVQGNVGLLGQTGGFSGGGSGFGALGLGGTNNPSLGGGGIGGFSGGVVQKGNYEPARALGDLVGKGAAPTKSMTPGSPDPAKGMQGRSDDIQIIQLKHISATSMAKTLRELFGSRDVRIIAEQESNSLLIEANPMDVETIRKVLDRVDQPTSKRGE